MFLGTVRTAAALVIALAIDSHAAVRAEDLWQLPAAPVPALSQTAPLRACESFAATRLSADASVREARVVRGSRSADESCRLTVAVATPRSPRIVTVWLMLPVRHWNGRFLGLGGGGWIPGFPAALNAGASLGFATAITNAGRPYDLSTDPQELSGMVGRNDFLLDARGHLDWTELENFAYRGIHVMTVVGKAVTREFYGTPPRYAYFSGCSTGGRQGQAEVQRYPQDYDGVLSGSPAINWAHFAAAESWPLTVTKELADVAQCKLDVAHRAAVAACDGDDGVRDGLVSGVETCRFDAKALVGMQTDCGVIQARDAEVIGQIWDGPRRRDGSRLWNGIDRAALIHAPQPPPDRTSPFSEGTALDADGLSYDAYATQFDQFVQRYGGVMDTSSPELSAFARHGRTILWHGVADDIIPAAGTVHYVDSIRRTLGERETDGFLRLYLAPGIQHCGSGDGPQPVALLEPLMQWVEQGRAPGAVRSENRDEAGRITRTRPLCPYPTVARYRGHGSLDDAASFECQR